MHVDGPLSTSIDERQIHNIMLPDLVYLLILNKISFTMKIFTEALIKILFAARSTFYETCCFKFCWFLMNINYLC